MKLLIIDPERTGLNCALRAEAAGHYVKLWMPVGKNGLPSPIGDGLVEKIPDWKAAMKWADMILPTDNAKYAREFEPYFAQGYPIFGANRESAALELDRDAGQKAMEAAGIETLPYEIFTDYDKAIRYVIQTNGIYVSKPWGGASDKALSYVSKSPADMVFRLQRWKDEARIKGVFMLQEFRPGIEMGVSAWFGPGGFGQWIEENWEEKKLMNEGLGVNTGEQGTTMRYVKKSKLFDMLLKPLEEQLHKLGYVGNVSINCIITKEGQVWPLEFTMRLGWPAFNIHFAMIEGDPIDWMLDLLEGKDTMQAKLDITVGVVMTHGDYPYGHLVDKENIGYPIYGITGQNEEHLHYQRVMDGRAPMMIGGKVKEVPTLVTADDYVMVVTGSGATVRAAQKAAYKTTWEINWPSNRMFRTDIGDRLKKELPLLQAHGFAGGMSY